MKDILDLESVSAKVEALTILIRGLLNYEIRNNSFTSQQLDALTSLINDVLYEVADDAKALFDIAYKNKFNLN